VLAAAVVGGGVLAQGAVATADVSRRLTEPREQPVPDHRDAVGHPSSLATRFDGCPGGLRSAHGASSRRHALTGVSALTVRSSRRVTKGTRRTRALLGPPLLPQAPGVPWLIILPLPVSAVPGLHVDQGWGWVGVGGR